MYQDRYDYSRGAQSYRRVRLPHRDVQELLRSLVPPGGVHVDLACGPCTETAFLASRASSFLGLDCTLPALAFPGTPPNALFVAADLSGDFPLRDGIADSCTLLSAVHHFEDTGHLFAEVARVLRPGKPIIILTNTHDQLRERGEYRYFKGVLEYNLRRFPPIPELCETLIRSRFENVTLIEIKRPWESLNERRVRRLSTGYLDSAFWILSEEEWREGLEALSEAVGAGVRIIHCRDRIAVLARRGPDENRRSP